MKDLNKLQNQKKIILRYYILSGLYNTFGMQIISAIYVSYLIKNGLNLFEVNLVNTCFFLTLFICEIPTGAFADIFGRKVSFVSACALQSISLAVYGMSHSFLGFVIAEIIGAIGCTFRTGAFQAWLVDSLKHYDYDELKEGGYGKIFGREGLIRQISGAIGAVTGSYLSAMNPSFPWFIGAGVMVLVTVSACIAMKEEYFTKSQFSWKRGISSMKEVVVKSVHYGSKNSAVRFILVITCLQIFACVSMNMYWQPLFKGRDLAEKYTGFLFAGMMVSLAIGSYIASKQKVKLAKRSGSEKRVIIIAQVFIGIFTIATACVTNLPISIVLFLLHEVPRGCMNPMVDSYLHQRIPSSERATITSFCAIAPHIGGAVGLLVSGIIAQKFGITTSWIVSGCILILGAILIGRSGNSK